MAREESPPGPVIISWSGLKRWENCPQHQLRVITKETEKQEKGRIFLPGTVCDLVQRRWLDSEDPQPGQMVDMVDQVFAEIVEKAESKIHWKGNPLKDQQQVRDHCRNMVSTIEPWLMENVLPFDYSPEVKFEAHMEIPYICGDGVLAPLKMIGGIDIVVRGPDGKFRLYDLKITQDGGYIRSTLAQLIFYDLAWSVIQGDWNICNEWGFLTPGLPERLIPITVDQDDRRAMMSRIVKYAQGVWTDNWRPKPTDEGCNFCEAQKRCDKFRLIATVDANGKVRASFDKQAEQRKKFRETA